MERSILIKWKINRIKKSKRQELIYIIKKDNIRRSIRLNWKDKNNKKNRKTIEKIKVEKIVKIIVVKKINKRIKIN